MVGLARTHNLPPAVPMIPPIPGRVLCYCFRCGPQGKWIASRTRYNHLKAETLSGLGIPNPSQAARIPGVLTTKTGTLAQVLENIKITPRKRRRVPQQYEGDPDIDVDERHTEATPSPVDTHDVGNVRPGPRDDLTPPSPSPGHDTDDPTEETNPGSSQPPRPNYSDNLQASGFFDPRYDDEDDYNAPPADDSDIATLDNLSQFPFSFESQDPPTPSDSDPSPAEAHVIDPGSLEDDERTQESGQADDSVTAESRSDTAIPSGAVSVPYTDSGAPTNIVPEELKISQLFIDALAASDLDHCGLSPEKVARIRNPPPSPIQSILDSDPNFRFSLDVFVGTDKGSKDGYDIVRRTINKHTQETLLSYHHLKKRLTDVTGVEPTPSDMCPGACVAYTGPWSDLDACPTCGTSRYEVVGKTRKPRAQYNSYFLASQLQAMWRSEDTARKLQYRQVVTEELNIQREENGGKIPVLEDVFYGTEFIQATDNGIIDKDSMVLVLSIDGAQLYSFKTSDCWMFVWVILDLSPDIRYKKQYVLPGGIIPGKPKNIDSFLFPSLQHLACLQKEGLNVWDASTKVHRIKRLVFAMETADTPGLAFVAGLVGHSGRFGCRLYCSMPGRHKDGRGQYFPVLKRPNNFNVVGSDHPDITLDSFGPPDPQRYINNVRLLQSARSTADYEKKRLATGIVRPSILLGLPLHSRFHVPNCFGIDIMHLVALNIPDFFIKLWRGHNEIKTEASDDKSSWHWIAFNGDRDPNWVAHGLSVRDATPYLPGSFHHAPRNPAEKISSGYKAWEFLVYFVGMGPAVFRGYLSPRYYYNYCKLISGTRILYQRRITTSQLIAAHLAIVDFAEEFEDLYYQRRADRIHLVRPSIHLITHAAHETLRLGPLSLTSQWPMENFIGNLGREIRQPSNPYANLMQRATLRAQINAIKSNIPDLEDWFYSGPCVSLPQGAIDLGAGYILLPAIDRYFRQVPQPEATAVENYVTTQGNTTWDPEWVVSIRKWGRLRLPTGQIARSAWRELPRTLKAVRMSRNVKFTLDGNIKIGEVLYYFRLRVQGVPQALAMVQVYSPPDQDLLADSFSTLFACQKTPNSSLLVISIKSIESVVAMIPLPLTPAEREDPTKVSKYKDYFYLVEKPGLDVAQLQGFYEADMES